MPHQVQQLINKIRTEGIDQANANAQEIENEAKAKAAKIIADAEKQASEIKMNAEMENKKMKEAGERALEQAARNMLLSLRKDIESILNGIITHDIEVSLSADRVAQLLEQAILNYMNNQNSSGSVQVVIGKDTAKELGDHFATKLKEKLKQDIVFKPSGDVNAGFMVSFDAGKTNFDFTDQSLASFLSVYVNEQLGEILKRTVN